MTEGPAPPFLGGLRVSLVPLERSSLDTSDLGWLNDEHAAWRIHDPLPLTLERADAVLLSPPAGAPLTLSVMIAGRRVGGLILDRFDWWARSAWIALGLADEEQWDAAAAEAWALLIDHAFTALGLRHIATEVRAGDLPAAVLAQLGFREEGRLREHAFADGRHVDVVVMGLLKRESAAPEASPGSD